MLKKVWKASSLGSRMLLLATSRGIGRGGMLSLRILTREGPRDFPLKLVGDWLTAVLGAAGPVYVKLGQVLSTRPDLLPPTVCQRLESLLDRHEALPYRAVHAALKREYDGVEWPFAQIDKKPAGAGSIGQVHFAELKSGERVAVKLLRPGIEARVGRDLAELGALAELAIEHYPLDGETRKSARFLLDGFMGDLSEGLKRECDFSFERDNLREFRERFGRNPAIVVPRVFEAQSTRNVIVMERVDGVPLHEVLEKRPDTDRARLARAYFQEILRQVFEVGHFHADPHSGNILVLPDGRLALIDLGLTGRLGARERSVLGRAVKAFVARDADALIATLLEFGELGPRFDLAAFKADIKASVLEHKSKATADLGAFVQELFKVAYKHEIYIPRESTLLIKTLVTLEGVTRSLDPHANLAQLAAPVLLKSLARRWLPWRSR